MLVVGVMHRDGGQPPSHLVGGSVVGHSRTYDRRYFSLSLLWFEGGDRELELGYGKG